ncbi:MAG: carbon storage regulator [Planctomycetota bacterium]
MLVLTRKTQERIHIGDNITISILKLKGNTVRIGIEAPRDIRVLRGELPTFDGTFEIEATETADSQTVTSQTRSSGDESEQSDEEPTVSELEWKVLKRIAGRRQPCLPVRRCSPEQGAAASLAPVMRATSLTAAPVAASE